MLDTLDRLCYNMVVEANRYGAFLFSQKCRLIAQLVLRQKRPFRLDLRPAVRLDNDGKNERGVFVMDKRKAWEYRQHWQTLIDYHGSRCYYCRKEIATTIDHVVPWSYDQDNEIDNLVPACVLCNCLASNKHFDTVEQKRQYIINQRSKRANQTVVCTACMLPFTYRTHSPSLFLCAECYDAEYRTHYAEKPKWQEWLYLLRQAGIPAEAHRTTRIRLSGLKSGVDRDVRLETLIDEYANVVASDPYFAELLVRH